MKSTNDIPVIADNPHESDLDDAVKRAVWQLPASARELVVLRYYDNMTYQQMSEILGLSTQAINGRLTRAKRKIANYLKRDGFPEGEL